MRRISYTGNLTVPVVAAGDSFRLAEATAGKGVTPLS
jgi:hypothetical protein